MVATAISKKKQMALIGLTVVLFVALGVRFLGVGGGAVDTSSAGGTGGFLGRPVGFLDSDPTHLRTVAKIATARARTIYAGWDFRDPMKPLVAERRAAPTNTGSGQEVAAPVTLPPMTLSGVVWDPESALAMIDGAALRVGDTIKGAKVVEIGIDRVALVYKSKRFVLTVD